MASCRRYLDIRSIGTTQPTDSSYELRECRAAGSSGKCRVGSQGIGGAWNDWSSTQALGSASGEDHIPSDRGPQKGVKTIGERILFKFQVPQGQSNVRQDTEKIKRRCVPNAFTNGCPGPGGVIVYIQQMLVNSGWVLTNAKGNPRFKTEEVTSAMIKVL